VFVQIGLVPNTEFLRSTVELNPVGENVIDGQGQTHLPRAFAAGEGA
jgi:alkyl hydroperoxide reductase subunit F